MVKQQSKNARRRFAWISDSRLDIATALTHHAVVRCVLRS